MRGRWKNLILWVVMFHVVIHVEQTEFKIKIDKQGRLVIPSRVRKAMGINGESEGVLRVRGRTIIIEIVNNDIKDSVEKWYEEMKKMKIRAFSSKEETPRSKWMSDAYAKKKLGLD